MLKINIKCQKYITNIHNIYLQTIKPYIEKHPFKYNQENNKKDKYNIFIKYIETIKNELEPLIIKKWLDHNNFIKFRNILMYFLNTDKDLRYKQLRYNCNIDTIYKIINNPTNNLTDEKLLSSIFINTLYQHIHTNNILLIGFNKNNKINISYNNKKIMNTLNNIQNVKDIDQLKTEFNYYSNNIMKLLIKKNDNKIEWFY